MIYRITRRASEDMFGILMQGIESFGPIQAGKYIDGMQAAFEHLAAFPQAHAERPEFRPPLRVYPYGAHLIFYRLEEDAITIVRVRHGHEDWQET